MNDEDPVAGEPDRRVDNVERDRIGTLAKALQKWRDGVDDWRVNVDTRIRFRTYIVFGVLVIFTIGFVAAGGATRDLYRRNADRSRDAARIVEQFQASREQNARASCEDRNTDRANLRGLGEDLGGERLAKRVAARFPHIDCDTYVRDSLTSQGRDPLPPIVPTPTPTPRP